MRRCVHSLRVVPTLGCEVNVFCAQPCRGVLGGQVDVVVPEGYIRIPVNANQGGSTADKVWIMFKRDQAGSAITNVVAIAESDPVPAGFRVVGAAVSRLVADVSVVWSHCVCVSRRN